MIKKHLSLLCALLFFATAFSQSDDQLKLAFRLRDARKYKEADAVFTSILNANPEQEKALEGRAFTRAWHRDFAGSEKDFIKLSLLQPNNPRFKKELANLHLAGHDFWQAERDFQKLIRDHGEAPEYLQGLASVYISTLQQKKARAVVEALVKKNKTEEATWIGRQVQRSPGLLELAPFAGGTRINEEIFFKAHGLEVALQPHRNIKLYGRYEYSAGLDLLSLVKNTIPEFSFYGGGTLRLGKKTSFFTTIEGGHRHYSELAFQRSFRAEENIVFASSVSIKLGALYAPKSDHYIDFLRTNEYLFYAGIGIPVAKNLVLQPTYFYLTNDVTKTRDHRVMLQSNYKWRKGPELNIGLMAGKDEVKLKDLSMLKNDVYSVLVQPSLPIGKKHWLVPVFQYEKNGQREVFKAAIGFRFRIER
jgi:tetratricopeptide (TPR) repeat protein